MMLLLHALLKLIADIARVQPKQGWSRQNAAPNAEA